MLATENVFFFYEAQTIAVQVVDNVCMIDYDITILRSKHISFFMKVER